MQSTPHPDRTPEMAARGQVWVWIHDRYVVKGTGVHIESWNQCNVEGCDRYWPCRHHAETGARPIGPNPESEVS